MWDAHATRLWDAPGAIVRASWLPANIANAIETLENCAPHELARLNSCATSLVGRAAIGAGLVRIDGDTASQARVIEQLRASSVFGNIVVVRASDALKGLVDVWGTHGDRQPLFDALKRAFDPNGVLNAGRGPL